jgi:hypothetical protein
MGKNGANGNNGSNGTNGKKFISIMLSGEEPEGGEIRDDAPFKPTIKMVIFQKVAIECSQKGLFLTQDWLKESHKNKEIPRVKKSEWTDWKMIDGFEEWFYEPMMDPCELEDRDMRMLEMAYWEAIRDGMKAGESWAVKEFSNRRWAKVADGAPTGDADIELARWIEQGGATNWKKESAEA